MQPEGYIEGYSPYFLIDFLRTVTNKKTAKLKSSDCSAPDRYINICRGHMLKARVNDSAFKCSS